MPRLFEIDKDTSDISELSKVLFKTELTKPQREAAKAALAAANPQLSLDGKLPPGRVLVVPDLPSFDPSATRPIGSEAFAAVAELTRSSLQGAAERIRVEHAAREAERSEVVKALKIVLKNNQDLRPLLERANKALKLEAEQDAVSAKRTAAIATQLLAELAALEEAQFR